MQTLYASSFSLDTMVVSETGRLYYSILKRNRPAQSFTSSPEGMRESQTINGHTQHTLVPSLSLVSMYEILWVPLSYVRFIMAY